MGWLTGKSKATGPTDEYRPMEGTDESLPVATVVHVEPTAPMEEPPRTTVAANNVQSAPPSYQTVSKTTTYIPPQQNASPRIDANTQAAMTASLQRRPMMLQPCPYCQKHSVTRIRTFPAWQTWLAVMLLLVLFWPLCWVPLVVDKMKKTDHHCKNCHRPIGSVAPFSDCCETRR